PIFVGNQKLWLSLHFVLVWSKSGCSGDPGCWVATGGHGFEGSSPTQVGRKIFGGDAVEASHPLFEASVVGVDVVDMELWFFGLGIAGRRQDVDFELGPLGESGDGRSAVAAEIGRRRNSFAECFFEAGCIEAREDGVERGAGAVASHDDGNLLGREGRAWRLCRRGDALVWQDRSADP